MSGVSRRRGNFAEESEEAPRLPAGRLGLVSVFVFLVGLGLPFLLAVRGRRGPALGAGLIRRHPEGVPFFRRVFMGRGGGGAPFDSQYNAGSPFSIFEQELQARAALVKSSVLEHFEEEPSATDFRFRRIRNLNSFGSKQIWRQII